MTNPPTIKAFRHESADPSEVLATLQACLDATPPRTQRAMSEAEVEWLKGQEQRAEGQRDERSSGRVSEQECLARADREAGWDR